MQLLSTDLYLSVSFRVQSWEQNHDTHFGKKTFIAGIRPYKNAGSEEVKVWKGSQRSGAWSRDGEAKPWSL